MSKTLSKTRSGRRASRECSSSYSSVYLPVDTFNMKLAPWGTILGLFIHLIPPIVLAIAIALAWCWEWIGAVIFGSWSIWYVSTARGLRWSVYAVIAGIPLMVGILFLLGWIYRKEIQSA